MSLLAILTKGRQIIEKPEAWTKSAYARNASGRGVTPCSIDAICFCAMGAVVAAEGRSGSRDFMGVEFLRKHIPDGYGESFISFNDAPKTTHADVLALYDRAIEDAREQEKHA